MQFAPGIEMSSQLHNDQEIIQYLLGSLPEAETERMDELSFTDAGFAELLRTTENDLVDGYVQGELTGRVLEQFKSHYLSSPRGREKVEFAQAFQVLAGKSFAAQPRGEDAAESARDGKGSEWIDIWRIFTIPRLAVAAAALILIAGAWLLIENTRREPPASVASFILTPQMRGTGQIRTISVPAKTGRVAMELELEPNDYSTYEVVLLDQPDNRTLWRSGELRATGTGNGQVLKISFSAGLLRPQTYVLRVNGVSATASAEIVGDYPIQIVK
jgi:anti-sigma factor RsiW